MIQTISFGGNMVDLVIKAHKIQQFVLNPVVQQHFLPKEDRIIDCLNPEYNAWEVHDQLLLVWLQSTLSKSVLYRVL
ncbi:hypothetical protein PHAVU_L001752 [Phaseolus vulgaris]|uniref:Uncharacterized protein n=2 Tax=Phaseolus vulgaris TaxID=3885 RepID=V7CVU1_PHAVU|nr:hypothetical protein PHAVU_001G038300g [Phaseolus vulgaris]ESW33041.1 hypothetical protein PHAVU_001G038300g [Phaseolus vulgaris]